MASGIIYGSTGNKYIDSKIEWSSTANNTANTSTVTASLYYKRNNTGFTTSGTGSFSLTIDGQSQSASKYLTITESGWVLAIAVTKTVAHSGDGTKTITISATGSIPSSTLSSTSCSGRVSLDTIPRASTITSAYAATLGSRCKIVWTPASTSFYYKVKFSLGSWSFTTEAFKPGVTSAYTYTGYPIDMAVANQFPDSPSGTMTATLYTYSDSTASTQIGSASSKTFTVTLPENESTMPSITMELSPVTPYEKFKSLYLQGISKVKATFSGEGRYGASIVAYSLQAEGGRYTEPYISNTLTQSGEIEIVGFVSDSRWFGNNTSQKINVIAYKAPYISSSRGYSKVICERCDKDGNADESGTYLHVIGTRNYTKINTNGIVNTCRVKCRYKSEVGAWSHGSGEGVLVTASEDEFDVVLTDIHLDPTMAYAVELNITDDTSLASSLAFEIPSEEIAFELREGGGGAAFGKHAVREKTLECEWDARFNRKISLQDKEIVDVIIEDGSVGIWQYRKWLSGRVECWGRRSVTVNIATQWGAVYYGSVDAYAFPSGLFTSAPFCQVTAEFGNALQAAWTAISGEATKDNAPAIFFCRPMAEEAGFDILYYAIGSWK